jgi:hypothetical protein
MEEIRRCPGRNRGVQEFAAEGCLRRGYSRFKSSRITKTCGSGSIAVGYSLKGAR